MMKTLVLAALLGYLLSSPAEAAQCEKDWKYYNKNCYLFQKNIQYGTWNGHRNVCINHGANLVSIHSSEEQNFIHNEMKKVMQSWQQYWIGMSGTAWKDYSGFKWSDHTAVDYTNWPKSEPANPGNRMCVSVTYDGLWQTNARCDYLNELSVCKKDMNDCDRVTCQHGGRCVDLYQKYECDCAAGYTGKHCETDIDDCDGVTCQHGGICVDQVNGYQCNCKPGYSGTHCETNIDECADVTCKRDYVCKDGVDSYCCVPNPL